LLKRVLPSIRWELTDINGELASWKGDQIAHFMSKSLPCDRIFCSVEDHARALAKSKRQRKRRRGASGLVLDDINFNKIRDTLNGNGYFDLVKQMGSICGVI
jgi:hypothetical protein